MAKRKRCPKCSNLVNLDSIKYAEGYWENSYQHPQRGERNYFPGVYVCAECADKQNKKRAREEALDSTPEMIAWIAENTPGKLLAKEKAKKRTLEAFDSAAWAKLPKDGEESASVFLHRTADKDGGCEPHALDRFVFHDSLESLIQSAQVKTAEAHTPFFTSDVKRIFDLHSTLITGKVIDLESNTTTATDGLVYPSWEGFNTQLNFGQVKQFLDGGWPEGAALMAKSMAKIQAPYTQNIRRRARWADEGDEVDLDRAYAGQLERAFRTSRRTHTTGITRVRIVIDLGASCGECDYIVCTYKPVRPEELFWRGAAAAALCESLETAGYSVEIVAGVALRNVNAIRMGGEKNSNEYHRHDAPSTWRLPTNRNGPRVWWPATWATCFVAKDYETPLSPELIAAATAHVSVFRRVILADMAAHAPCKTDFGTLDSLRNPRVMQELGLEQEGSVTVHVNDWVLTPKTANAWVKGTLYGLEYDKTGVHIDEAELEQVEA